VAIGPGLGSDTPSPFAFRGTAMSPTVFSVFGIFRQNG
jgi:hypothetical protein